MPVFLIKKDVSCSDSLQCSDLYHEKLSKGLPDLFHNDESANFHISIVHEKNNHLLWVCIYEKENEVITASSKTEIVTSGKNYLQTLKMELDDGIKIKPITKGILGFDTIKTSHKKARKYKHKMPSESKISDLLE
tara:strand:+ start:213 stop:617 length:405 start_codon:yes stop_codon:yes gene_type:complete